MRTFSLVGALALLTSCAGTVTTENIVGLWGGQHVALELFTAGASLEYDCAHGTIDRPIIPDADGRFLASGTHVTESGGPVREGEEPEPVPATYDGWTDGTRMTLRVRLADGTDFGTFELRLGDVPRVFKCL